MNDLHSRRSERISISLAVEVSGSNPNGTRFSAPGTTLLISRHGATVQLKHTLIPDQPVVVSRPQTGKMAKARVVGSIRRQPDGEVFALELDEKDVGFWDVAFSTSAARDESVAKILLECNRCRTREVVCLNELEIEVYEANRSILLRCKHCEGASLWTLAQHDLGSGPPASATAPVAAPAAPAARTSNDRKHIRMRVKMTACIRLIGFDDDVVAVENMSRGGLGFKSPQRYPKGSQVDVALPYSPGGANIFVPARVVFVKELPAEGVSRYGVAYIRAN